ncbi:SMP-30/gluconolactonase/LRE family protein [Pimelobacter simplex]|uniref:SMP-30/gluconolactonase/LRE family protein n=1 Tax=Nocardioides simplex TaxID=2045 RepID=UPI001933863C|nr:SMP-30/gluconolactonase/LRE family protein [Pimelobacter simplex]
MSVEVVADGLGFTEGPVALPDGRVALTSISHGCVYLVAPSGSVERIETGGGPNGLAQGPRGELYVAQNGGVWGGSGPAPAGVQVIENGKVDYLATADMGAPNDLAFGPDGRLWVTDTVAELEWGKPETGRPGKVLAVDIVDGSVDVLLAEGPVFLNGLAFTSDEAELLVTATVDRCVLAYRWSAGVLDGPCRVVKFTEDANPDGMARTRGDRFWVALLRADRLDLVDRVRGVVGTIALPTGCLPTNVCLDHDGAGLFVTAGFAGSLLRVPGTAAVAMPDL